jgi:2-dehydro-3-deoxygluconokinase
MVTSTEQADRTDPSMLDVVALGDAMVGFAPPGHLRLEQASSVEVWPTGAEANAVVLMARLGLRVGWFSKLPDHPLSRLIVGAIRAHGVDTSRLVWTAEGRVGTFFYERSVPPRPSRVWYDRQGSAFTTLNAGDVDWPYLTSARVVLMAGTAPALSAGLRDLTLRIARETRAAGNAFALDVNYRAKLWPAEEAGRYFAELLPHVSILFCGRADAERVFGLRGSPEAVAGAFRDRFGIPLIVLTQGAEGALALGDRIYCQRQIPRTQVVDAVGAGDAFAGGFLCGYLEGGVQRGLDWGGATGALACTVMGDFAVVTRSEVEELLASGEQEIQR